MELLENHHIDLIILDILIVGDDNSTRRLLERILNR